MKVSNSYASVVRGVSQQTASQRLDGQHEEQVNMLSDPVNGLSRRRGSVYLSETSINSESNQVDFMRGIRKFECTIAGVDYVLLYPTVAVPNSSWRQAVKAYRKDTGAWCPLVTSGSDFSISRLDSGIAAITQVGRYIVMAPKEVVTGGTIGDVGWNSLNNSKYGVLWIRGGFYSRTYRAEIVISGVRYTANYTTPAASYQGNLDTSDIPATTTDGEGNTIPNPNYTKLVNDRVNAYNAAVTQWIATAGAAVQPPAIAIQLANAINSVVSGTGTTVLANGPYIYVENVSLQDMAGSDGGDGTGLRTTYKVSTSVEQLSAQHFAGKIVKIQAKDGDPSFYMRAVPMRNTAGFGPVTWEETAGEPSGIPFPFLIASIEGGNLHMAGSPLAMRGLAPEYASLPDMGQRVAGDKVSSPDPAFANRAINHLANFQDRLVVSCGAVMSASRPGDYFNFYRESNLTVRDDDPVEAYALGSESDVIRHSVIFDKSLVAFGDKQQYSIDGRIPLTPSTSTIIQSSAHEGAVDAVPITNGELVFFGKSRENSTKLYQIEIGDVQDTSRASEITLQLTNYLRGIPVEIAGTTSPNLILVRSSGDFNSIGTFRYVDRGRERLLESWSRWTYSPEIGEIVAMSRDRDQLLVFHYKPGAANSYVVCRQSLLADNAEYPYLDAQRVLGTSSVALGNTGQTAVVMGSNARRYEEAAMPGALASLQADFPELVASDIRQGFNYSSYVELTSPFRRDQNGNVVVTGRLTITRVDVSYKNSSGMVAEVVTDFGTSEALRFNGRLLGSPSSTFTIPVETGSVPVFVGRESREYVLRLSALTGKPLTISALEWTGQYFYNTRRG
jgi:hypothetical protein